MLGLHFIGTPRSTHNAQAWLGLGRAPVTQAHKHTDLDVSDWGWGGSMAIEKFGTHRNSFFSRRNDVFSCRWGCTVQHDLDENLNEYDRTMSENNIYRRHGSV